MNDTLLAGNTRSTQDWILDRMGFGREDQCSLDIDDMMRTSPVVRSACLYAFAEMTRKGIIEHVGNGYYQLTGSEG